MEIKTDRNKKNAKILIILSIILLVAFAGCTTKKTTNTSNVDVKVPQVGSGPDWCKAGTKMTSTGPSGEVSFEIKGIVNYEGKDVCSAEWSSGNGSMVQYFNEDQTYIVLITKDKSGTVVNKIDMSQPKQ